MGRYGQREVPSRVLAFGGEIPDAERQRFVIVTACRTRFSGGLGGRGTRVRRVRAFGVSRNEGAATTTADDHNHPTAGGDDNHAPAGDDHDDDHDSACSSTRLEHVRPLYGAVLQPDRLVEPAGLGVRPFHSSGVVRRSVLGQLEFAGIANPALRGTVDVSFNDYSVPIYDAAATTTTVRVFQAGFAQTLGIPFIGIAIGDSIPWNPSWRPGTGNDRIMSVIDHTTGRTWELWDAYDPPLNCFDFWGPNNRAGYDMTNANNLCVGSATTYTNLLTATDGTTTNDRGMGINKLALITRADEVASGGINHALEMTVFNTMFGPLCSADQLNTAAAGVDCAFSLPPATRVEYATGPTLDCGANTPADTPAARSRTVPEGMRFALDLTDTQINAWLDSRGYTGTTRNTARIFAVALRDYGWIIGETGCYGAAIETDGLIDPVSRAKWSALGIQDSSTVGQLLHGLFTQSAVYVVNPSGPATAVPW